MGLRVHTRVNPQKSQRYSKGDVKRLVLNPSLTFLPTCVKYEEDQQDFQRTTV